MILRFLTFMALVVSLAVPALAKPLLAKSCPSQSSIEMCYSADHLAVMSGQSSLEQPCGSKALPCLKGVLPDVAEREAVLVFSEAHMAWISQTFGPPEKPPRI